MNFLEVRKERNMKLHRIYNIVINDIIYATSSNYQQIIKMFDNVRKAEPKAYITTYYA